MPIGDRPTIVDVAREARTSVSSASVALRGEPGVSEETRKRIVRVAEQLGYHPDRYARWLRSRKTHVLGVTFTLTRGFHAEVVEELYAAAATTGYDLILSGTTPNRDARQAAERLVHDRCEALILISPALHSSDLVKLAENASVVIVDSELECDRADRVAADDRVGNALAVDALVSHGHRDIHHVDGGTAPMSAARREGYLRAMDRHGLADRARITPGGTSESAGIAAAESIFRSSSPPTAVIAYNDTVAFGLLLSLRGRGVEVPDHVSIIGYDDTRLASLQGVDLTSVSPKPAALAAAAVTYAIEQAEAKRPHNEVRHTTIAPVLVVRKTSGPVTRTRS